MASKYKYSFFLNGNMASGETDAKDGVKSAFANLLAITTGDVPTLDMLERSQVAAKLADYNLWRRGEGDYAPSDDPAKNKKCPLTPYEAGVLIDKAVDLILSR